MQIYLPDDLYQLVKQRELPASELLQKAVRAELRRQDLLAETDRYVADLLEEVGPPTGAQRVRAEIEQSSRRAAYAGQRQPEPAGQAVGGVVFAQSPEGLEQFALPRGRMATRLKRLELLDVPIETVQEVAEFEQRETRRRFEELARRMTGLGSAAKAVAEALRTVEEDHPKPEELLRATEQAVDKAYELVALRQLVTAPRRRPQVAELPAYRFGFLMLSLPAPLEPEREPQLLVDPVDPGWKDKKRVADHLRLLNRSQLLLAAAREVVPGQMTQVMAARAHSGEHSALRARTYSASLIEGFASD